jgi:hypothetical protein
MLHIYSFASTQNKRLRVTDAQESYTWRMVAKKTVPGTWYTVDRPFALCSFVKVSLATGHVLRSIMFKVHTVLERSLVIGHLSVVATLSHSIKVTSYHFLFTVADVYSQSLVT